jgi:hypothetical protein
MIRLPQGFFQDFCHQLRGGIASRVSRENVGYRFLTTDAIHKDYGIMTRMLPYEYQYFTYQNGTVSRHASVINFCQMSRIRNVIFRFKDVTLSIPHMFYFSIRFRFINLHRVQFCWKPFPRTKSRRWVRKFGKSLREMFARVLLTPYQFFMFWTMFICVFMARRTFSAFKRRVGSGNYLMHWFLRHEMYWEFPAVPNVFFQTNADARLQKINFYLRIELSRQRRSSFIVDRDLFRFLNFPIQFYVVPRMWQPDPSTYVCYLRYKEFKQSLREKND